MALRIDLAWMLRTGRAREGMLIRGTLHWNCGGEPAGSISYAAHMDEPGQERLELSYVRGEGEGREHVRQTVHLCHTLPHYGGKRWWMICPYRAVRAGKLYKPAGGDRFASRQAWRLGYNSQRQGQRDRPFEKLFRIQRKLGGNVGWEQPIRRPKGMWQRTFERHLDAYWRADEQCAVEMMGLVERLSGRLK